MLAKLKSALKNHKKVVDKNVPLNRLAVTLQNWLNEPVLNGLAADFENEKCHFIRSEPPRVCRAARRLWSE